MIDVAPRHLRTVRHILARIVPGCEARVFGSRVSGTAKDSSDLDLAVVCEERLDFDTLRLLREAFEESDLPFRVDALDWHAVSDSFRGVIEAGYEALPTDEDGGETESSR